MKFALVFITQLMAAGPTDTSPASTRAPNPAPNACDTYAKTTTQALMHDIVIETIATPRLQAGLEYVIRNACQYGAGRKRHDP